MSPETKTVLLADDEIFMLRLLESTFRKGGYRVVQARTGREALAISITEKPDLIVMDVMMPDLDGLSAIHQLRQTQVSATIPVIVLSSKGHALTKMEAELAGASLFLTKPFSPNQLLTEAGRILGEN
jgi:CheY-like chemotaxis protein